MDTLDSLGDPLVLPDDFNGTYPLDADPLIQVHSVTLHPHDEDKSYLIYGRVYVYDKKNGRNDLYKQGWDNPEKITSGNELSLTGPVSGVISMVGEPKIYIQLKVRSESRKKQDPTTWFARVHAVLDTTTHLCYDEIKSLTRQGSLGDVRVDYIVMPCACIADLEISLAKEEESPELEGDDVPDDIANAHVFGSVIASYGTTSVQFGGERYVKQHPSFSLYDQQREDKGNPVAYGIPIKLDRSFVCMPACSSFLLTLNLTFKTCGDNEKIVVKESTEFSTPLRIYQLKNFSVGEFSVEVLLRLHTSDKHAFLKKIHKSPESTPSAFTKWRAVPKEMSSWGRNRIELLSVFVGHDERKEIDDIWGTIAVDFLRSSYCFIFERDENKPDKLSRRGKALSLEGFTTECSDSFCLCLRLKGMCGLVDIQNCLYICEGSYDIIRRWFDRPLCSVLFGKHGFAVVNYIIFKEAAKATVNFSVVAKKGSDTLPVVYGALVAQYSNYEYPTTFQKYYWRSVLFEEPQEKDARHLSEDGEIPLSKNVVSVPMGSSLVIDVDLHAIVRPSAGVSYDSLDVCTAAEHFKDTVEFEIGGIVWKKLLLGEHYDVLFYTEWTKGGVLNDSSPRFSASTSESSQAITHDAFPDIAVGPIILTRETTEIEHYAFKQSNFSFDNASIQSQSSSSGDSGSWVSAKASPESSFIGAHNDAPLPMGTPPQRPSLSTPPTGSYVGTTSTGAYISTAGGNPPTGPYTSAPHEVSPIGTPPTGPYVSTPADSPIENLPTAPYLSTPAVSPIETPPTVCCGNTASTVRSVPTVFCAGTPPGDFFVGGPPAVSFLGIPSGSEAGASQSKINELENLTAINEREKLTAVQYQKFIWEEIMEATKSLSHEFKIGTGGFGDVYKCKLHHTTVAVKVPHSENGVKTKLFVQELEILSTIRHPHLLLLLGAIPERSCLVYEYMDNGSLDDRLHHKRKKPPLPWYDSFRICYEVAGALAFLHSTTPRPIIHRDLKPANILLDHNLVSKIGDFGSAIPVTLDKDSMVFGTPNYMDPEYLSTRSLSTESDVYALGVVILRVLTAKRADGIASSVKDAIDKGKLADLLDPEAGEWPEKETLELAVLGLQCAELSRTDRPDLSGKILPTLERLKEMADSARESVSSAHTAAPPHYYCPILKDVMEDPCVAADGYTYERRAIEQWLTANDTSPTTNQPLPHKLVMPNNSLLDAIKQWKSKKQRK